ncbi:hypothetical protein HG530_008013 [Fusarium avenaceum]|nr:hypothetical protein HG530_008013 [Fusarium avenaceum]
MEVLETSPYALLRLFIAAAAAANRDFLKRAYLVLDTVVGHDRFPRFSDRPSLAYVDTSVSELMRWRSISPGSIPRRADKQDEFQGISIARNTTIFANAWSVGRDRAAFYPLLGDLDHFFPERLLTSEEELETSFPLPVFGRGRRGCLGKQVCLDGSFANIAAMLTAFDLEQTKEVDSMDVVFVGFMTDGA